jgi:hypothetical protein
MKYRILMTIALAAGSVAVAGAQSRWGSQDPYYGQRPYDNRGGYGMQGGQAYQIGMDDGRRDGERDLYTRHSFRPEEHGNFKHADRGYNGRFGDKRYYKEQYRAGYLEGYRMGYRSSGGWRR